MTSTTKKVNTVKVMFDRELKSFFASPMAYVVGVIFLVITGFLVFNFFFLGKKAELRSFFEFLPVLFTFFIPALTMRVFSEEKRVGSLETLVTLPVRSSEVVAAKFLASLVSCLIMLAPTLFYVLTCAVFGNPDYGPIICGYIGAVFLIASYTAIGLFASSITKNQVLSFFVALVICCVLTFLSNFAVLMPAAIANFIAFVSTASHFESISRGIIDLRDVIYFVSLTVVFLLFTNQSVKKI